MSVFCFVVKAVHLELVSDLTSDSFVAPLRRFIARRGKPKIIWSDQFCWCKEQSQGVGAISKRPKSARSRIRVLYNSAHRLKVHTRENAPLSWTLGIGSKEHEVSFEACHN